MPAVREILIGRRAGEHVLLSVRGRLFPEGDDADWLWTSLAVRVVGFSCQQEGNLRASELRRFRSDVERLDDAAVTAATLSTEDEWVTIELTADGDRKVTARLRVRDAAEPPNELRCTLPGLEPAGLVATIESLLEVERAYPPG